MITHVPLIESLKTFVLFWYDGKTTKVEARNLIHAYLKSSLPPNPPRRPQSELIRFETGKKVFEISGQAQVLGDARCKCDHTAKQKFSCRHDLVRFGL
jgi:hypothetical protein